MRALRVVLTPVGAMKYHHLPSPSRSEPDTSDELFALDAPALHYERKLGDNELSYYLPGRAEGVNDMYLHLGLQAPHRLMNQSRISLVWALLRLRHPLLASRVDMRDYDDTRFVYTPPSSPDVALQQAVEQMEWKYSSRDELIETYLNGPRTLSNDRLSYLIISRPPANNESYPTPPLTPSVPNADAPALDAALPVEQAQSYEWLMCAAHCIGDGMALHAFANDFFGLLGSVMSDQELQDLLVTEWEKRCEHPVADGFTALPPSFEDSLPAVKGALLRAVGRVDFQNHLDKQIGGHAFPRRKAGNVRHTVVPTVSFDEDVTRKMLKKCKAEGVSIAGALFAICNIAWARISLRDQQTLPMMMYAAMNVRPCLVPRPMNDSYWFLAVGYFNVVLPSFIPSSCDISKTFWLRARSSKNQIIQAAKTPMLTSRSREMSIKRGRQSKVWAREDDEKANGTWVKPAPAENPMPNEAKARRPPSAALLGLSMLGNLDAVYKHSSFPEVKMNRLTTGSRQRHGGMLLFGYTFAGKLWVSLGYDENGFEHDPIAKFWDGMLGAMTEFLT